MLRLSSQGLHCALVTSDSRLHVYRLPEGTRQAEFVPIRHLADAIIDVAWLSDTLILAITYSGRVFIIDSTSGTEQTSTELEVALVSCASLPGLIALVTVTGEVRFYSLDLKEISRLQGPRHTRCIGALSDRDFVLATGQLHAIHDGVVGPAVPGLVVVAHHLTVCHIEGVPTVLISGNGRLIRAVPYANGALHPEKAFSLSVDTTPTSLVSLGDRLGVATVSGGSYLFNLAEAVPGATLEPVLSLTRAKAIAAAPHSDSMVVVTGSFLLPRFVLADMQAVDMESALESKKQKERQHTVTVSALFADAAGTYPPEDFEARLEALKLKEQVDDQDTIAPAAAGELLAQALRTRSNALIEKVFTHGEAHPDSIPASIEALAEDAVLALLHTVVDRLEKRPNRLAQMLPWLRCLMTMHVAVILSNRMAVLPLIDRANELIKIRLSFADDLAKLCGKLELLGPGVRDEAKEGPDVFLWSERIDVEDDEEIDGTNYEDEEDSEIDIDELALMEEL